MRITAAAFFLVWSIEKLVTPEVTRQIFSHFYLLDISLGAACAIGAVQTLIVLAFLLGLWKTLTYGLAFLMHAVSTVSTLGILLDPWGASPNHLFWAAVPVLGALAVLFLLREKDMFWTLESMQAASKAT